MEIIGKVDDSTVLVKVNTYYLSRLFRTKVDSLRVGTKLDIVALAEKYDAALRLNDSAKALKSQLDAMKDRVEKVLEHSRLYVTLPQDDK